MNSKKLKNTLIVPQESSGEMEVGMKNKFSHLKSQVKAPAVEKNKVVAIIMLTVTSIIIILSGAAFSVFSVMYDISFNILSSQVPGMVFGLVVTFLGVRYYLSVQKLKVEVYKTTSRFSWSNFKKDKSNKSVSKSR